ncbi:MAG: c-type cytochrome [Chitinophagaceae bacterium]|nr:c-type cytochrome [Chitinophagaceae bacterium]
MLVVMESRRLALLFFCTTLLVAACMTGADKGPAVSFDQYTIADGFEIQLAVSEPLIEAPVAMDFDNSGRMWVVEMRGFMPNIAGTGEDVPNGRISIVDGFDRQGRARNARVFLDSLVLPRAIALVYGGVLYAAPPNLWFVEINNDKPGKKVLVDSLYADEYSNPENQANGLLMNIDNWIYSAYSTTRYQLKDGKWIHEPALFRGQFGITKDNVGRLYYNYNEVQLAGDYVLPNAVIANPYMKPKEAVNKALTENQHIYPLHPTTVNRGYVAGILNKDSVLIRFTAACGPLIYRGDQFPAEYKQNAFVCEPEANLIKRNVLTFESLKTTAAQAWNDREFIASTDEGFRPVNVLNGPDGAMYVVDMHRGVMQHRVSATPYYRDGITRKRLDTLLHAGRILRIKYKHKKPGTVPEFDKAAGAELVSLLKSENGWIRDRAQQLLISAQQRFVIPELEKLAQSHTDTIAAIHALHTLEGLDALSFDLLQKVAGSGASMLSAHALLLLKRYNTPAHVEAMEKLAADLKARNDTVIDLYLALSLGPWAAVSPDTFLPLLVKLSRTYPESAVFQEAVVSSLNGLEERFGTYVLQRGEDRHAGEMINALLDQTIKNKLEDKKHSIFVQRKIPVPGLQKGLVIYLSTCAGCHGPDGEGIEHMGPPLSRSEYVSGSNARLGMIILNGLEGPIHINSRLYSFNGAMPKFRDIFSDEEIAGIMDYLHNSFAPADPKLSYGRPPVSPEEIKALRNKKPATTLTEQQLLETGD